MSTYQARIEDYTGSLSDLTAITDWLTNGAAYLIDRLPLEKFEKSTSDITDNGSGVNVKNMKIYRAHKNGYEAQRVSAGLKSQLIDSDSIHYRFSNDPAFYIENGLLYIVPSGGTAIGITYPIVNYNDTSSTIIGRDLDQALVLYAVIQALLQKYNTQISTLLSTVFTNTEVIPTAPASVTITYTDAVLGTYTTTTIGVDEVVPTYTKPTFGGSYTQFDTYLITNHDVELASTELNRQKNLLDEFVTNIQNEQAEFNKELQIYLNVLNKEIEQARLTQQRILETANKTTDLSIVNEAKTMEAEIAQAKMNLERYANQIQIYGIDVNKSINIYSNDIQKNVAVAENYIKMIAEIRNEFNGYLK